jgi:high-affinity iron transporter
MLGIQPRPTVAEVLVWLLYVVPMGILVLWPAKRPAPTPESRPRTPAVA